MSKIFIFVIAFYLLGEAVAETNAIQWDGTLTAGKDDRVKISWKQVGKYMRWRMEASSPGWLGLGWAPTDHRMTGADMIILTRKGTNYFLGDYYGVGMVEPVMDRHQDVTATAVGQKDGNGWMEFTKLLDTGDIDDKPITGNELEIIWAYGRYMDRLEFHVDSGSETIRLKPAKGESSVVTPKVVPKAEEKEDPRDEKERGRHGDDDRRDDDRRDDKDNKHDDDRRDDDRRDGEDKDKKERTDDKKDIADNTVTIATGASDKPKEGRSESGAPRRDQPSRGRREDNNGGGDGEGEAEMSTQPLIQTIAPLNPQLLPQVTPQVLPQGSVQSVGQGNIQVGAAGYAQPLSANGAVVAYPGANYPGAVTLPFPPEAIGPIVSYALASLPFLYSGGALPNGAQYNPYASQNGAYASQSSQQNQDKYASQSSQQNQGKYASQYPRHNQNNYGSGNQQNQDYSQQDGNRNQYRNRDSERSQKQRGPSRDNQQQYSMDENKSRNYKQNENQKQRNNQGYAQQEKQSKVSFQNKPYSQEQYSQNRDQNSIENVGQVSYQGYTQENKPQRNRNQRQNQANYASQNQNSAQGYVEENKPQQNRRQNQANYASQNQNSVQSYVEENKPQQKQPYYPQDQDQAQQNQWQNQAYSPQDQAQNDFEGPEDHQLDEPRFARQSQLRANKLSQFFQDNSQQIHSAGQNFNGQRFTPQRAGQDFQQKVNARRQPYRPNQPRNM